MKRFLLYIVLLLTASFVRAADVRFEVNAPTIVGVGERFRIEFMLSNAQADKFTPPTFTGLNVLAGPTIATGTEMIIVNGAQSNNTYYTYTYVVQAQKAGKATVSSASVDVGGKKISTKSTVIEIAAGSNSPLQNGSSGRSSQSNKTLAADDILLRINVNKNTVHKGEPIVATMKIYTRVGIAGLENAKYPAFNGFWTQELEVGNVRPEREVIDNKVYESQIMRQWLIYPQRAGILDIEQSEFVAVAQLVTQATGMSMFDQIFGGSPTVEHVNRKITSAPIRITVKELPQPQPDGFSGAVGRFTMESSISANQFSANSGGSIIVKLSGTGDYPLITAPKITLPAAFELYDTKQTENIKNTIGGTTGTRQWEYPFIARAEGEYTLPAVQISYFDPSTAKYVTLTSGEFTVKVTKDLNPGSSVGSIVSGVTKEDLKLLGQDIRFVRVGDPELGSSSRAVLWSVTFFAALLVIGLAFVGMLFFLKVRISQRADVVRSKNKKANKVALRRLRRAKGYMQAAQETAFFEEMLRALWGYMGDKLALPVSSLTKERVREEFAARGVSTERCDEFLTLVSECEFAQYSPISGVQMDKAYNAALDLIGRLEIN